MKKTILTLEDSQALNFVLNTVLEKDYEVASVNNYTEAFDYLQSSLSNDLMIINIPDTDSDNFQFLEHISTSYMFRNIPKVVISKSNDESLKKKSAELGAALFLTKPFDPVYLSDKVQDLIYTRGKGVKTKKRRSFNLNIF
jgi:two-component system chemotaxis response regulator CheY